MFNSKAFGLAWIVIAIFSLIIIPLCYGKAYTDLEPGVSDKSDVDKLLGNPVGELVKGLKYQYAPLDQDAKRVLVEFYGPGRLVKTIEIYPRDSYLKNQFIVWFELDKPDEAKKDEKDRLVEYYISGGIALHYAGPDDSSPIEFFSYFDPDSPESETHRDPPKRLRPVYLLTDDFDLENKGKGELNYADFANWVVADGTVDVIGNGFFDFYPEYGLYVDLDGSTSKAGTLESKTAFRLEPGEYKLEFDLAGSPMSGPNHVSVTLGNSYREEFTMAMKEPFKTITRDISVTSPEIGTLSFEHTGGDNQGLLLDNVRLIRFGGSLGRHGERKQQRKEELEKNETYFVQKTDIAIENKEWIKAKRLIDEGLQKFPYSAELWQSRAFYYFKNKSEPSDLRPIEVQRSMKRAYELKPSGKHAADMGWVYRTLHKDCYAALSYFEEAEKKGYAKKQKALFYWMAWCYEKTAYFALAKDYYRRFLSSDPKHEKAEDARRRLHRLSY